MPLRDMDDYRQLLRNLLIDTKQLVRATFSGRQRGKELEWKKLVIRPVIIRDETHLQFTFYDERKTYDHNAAEDAIHKMIDEVLQLPFRNFVVITRTETIQINLSKKGRPQISRQANETTIEPDMQHNRQKQIILQEGTDIPFLRVLGLTNEQNQVRHKQRDKFKQIQSLLQILSDIDTINDLPDDLNVVDFGCGSAYLTLATYYYLHDVLGKHPTIVGVDHNAPLMEKNQQRANQLEWHQLKFIASSITDYRSAIPANIVLALHACDTASDDALAQAAHWQSDVVLVAPCCHHDLQVKLKEQPTPAPFQPMLRYGLMHERIGDMLTDTFRTQILKVLGYQVDMLQFVAADHTPKNILIRGVYTGHNHQLHRQEYVDLLSYWQVQPYLHELLADNLQALLVD